MSKGGRYQLTGSLHIAIAAAVSLGSFVLAPDSWAAETGTIATTATTEAAPSQSEPATANSGNPGDQTSGKPLTEKQSEPTDGSVNPAATTVEASTGDPTTATATSSTTTPASTASPTTTSEQPAAPSAVPPSKPLAPMSQVKLLYKQGKYRDALLVIATVKPTELTHYYTGLCYQGQGQITRAMAEFTYVASSAKDPTVKYNAQLALRGAGSYANARNYSGQGNNFAAVRHTQTTRVSTRTVITETQGTG